MSSLFASSGHTSANWLFAAPTSSLIPQRGGAPYNGARLLIVGSYQLRRDGINMRHHVFLAGGIAKVSEQRWRMVRIVSNVYTCGRWMVGFLYPRLYIHIIYVYINLGLALCFFKAVTAWVLWV